MYSEDYEPAHKMGGKPGKTFFFILGIGMNSERLRPHHEDWRKASKESGERVLYGEDSSLNRMSVLYFSCMAAKIRESRI